MLLSLSGVAATAHADDSLRLAEQKIKAGLLYNFIKHTTWPSAGEKGGGDSLPPMTVCVYGDDGFADYLRPMDGRTVNQRKLVLRRIGTVPESARCDIVFVSEAEKGDWAELHRFLQVRQVLTVSDFAGFARSGGMIEFHEKDKRIGAIFNLEAFDKAGLHISGSLLELAGVEKLPVARGAP